MVRPIGKANSGRPPTQSFHLNHTAMQVHPLVKKENQSVDTVFETILADIVRGTYNPGSRLPAERELAKIVGASRPTLREALRRLTEWKLVEPKRGSGIVVRNVNQWSIEALPAYLRYRPLENSESTIPQIFKDLLGLRRSMICHIVEIVAPRVSDHGIQEARLCVQRAWDARENARDFIIQDFGVMRTIVEGASFYPAVWLLNRLEGVYVDMAGSISGHIPTPSNYFDVHQEFLNELERKNPVKATEIITNYLKEHDEQLMSAFSFLA